MGLAEGRSGFLSLSISGDSWLLVSSLFLVESR